MWAVLKVLGWFGIGLVAWMLLSVACLGFMCFRGWLNPKRAEKIREREDSAERGDDAVGASTCQKAAVTPAARPRRSR